MTALETIKYGNRLWVGYCWVIKIKCAHWSCQVAPIEICEIFWVNRLFFPILLNIYKREDISWLPMKLECFSVLRTCGLLGGLFSVCQKRWVLFTINFWISCYTLEVVLIYSWEIRLLVFFFLFDLSIGLVFQSPLSWLNPVTIEVVGINKSNWCNKIENFRLLAIYPLHK